MIRSCLSLVATLSVAACSPPVRDVSFFEANPEIAAKVVSDCAAGKHRGDECTNARAAESSLRRDERIEAYKKNF